MPVKIIPLILKQSFSIVQYLYLFRINRFAVDFENERTKLHPSPDADADARRRAADRKIEFRHVPEKALPPVSDFAVDRYLFVADAFSVVGDLKTSVRRENLEFAVEPAFFY
jgi:hypothetical protein